MKTCSELPIQVNAEVPLQYGEERNMDTRTILLVEDDEAIREGLSFSFAQTGHRLISAENIKEAKTIAEGNSLNLVLLDIALPDGNGFEFYENWLKTMNVPVIFLTARDDENDIVKGLEEGAEDYITKPFSVKELMIRVNKVLARQKNYTILKSGDITYDIEKLEVKKDGVLIELSKLEIRILRLLFENGNKVVDRNAMIDLIWEATGNDVYDHTVTVYIRRIREKLGTDIIKTVKGVGYRIDVE